MLFAITNRVTYCKKYYYEEKDDYARKCNCSCRGFLWRICCSKLGVDPLFESNVEALSRNESGGCSYGAYEYDDEFFENTKTFIRCGDCSWVSGTSPKYTNC